MKSKGAYIITGVEPAKRTALCVRSATRANADAPRFSGKMTAFLAAIQVMPIITRAAKAAGIHRGSHYRKLRSSPAYAIAFQDSLMIGLDSISDLLVERAVLGLCEPIVYRGRIATRKDPEKGTRIPLTVRKYDNQLLAFLLEHRHPAYAQRR